MKYNNYINYFKQKFINVIFYMNNIKITQIQLSYIMKKRTEKNKIVEVPNLLKVKLK